MPRLPYPPRNSEFVWRGNGEIARPVFGIDCDGTLTEFHMHFFQFAEQYLGIKIPPYYDGTKTMAEHIGVSKRTYREVKLHFRLSGLKRAMPVIPQARELCFNLRRRGAEIIICTTRPFLKVDGLEEDTRECLRRNRIQHDGVIHGENKYRELLRRAGRERIVGVLDDLPEMIQQATAIGLPAVLLRRPQNDYWRNYDPQTNSLLGAEAILLNMLNEWEKKTWQTRAARFLQLPLPLS
jgi:phosphoglycolate phosphatase-like HAD superfamily hydrolase